MNKSKKSERQFWLWQGIQCSSTKLGEIWSDVQGNKKAQDRRAKPWREFFFTGWPRQSRIVNHPRWKMRRREQFYGLFSASLSIFQSASPHDYSIIQSNFLEKIWIFSRCNQSVAPLFSKLTPLSTGSKEFFDTKFSRQLRHFEVGKKWF